VVRLGAGAAVWSMVVAIILATDPHILHRVAGPSQINQRALAFFDRGPVRIPKYQLHSLPNDGCPDIPFILVPVRAAHPRLGPGAEAADLQAEVPGGLARPHLAKPDIC
jgi:hypothetical protein